MAERRTIGQILMSFGRITEEDVARALEYQKEHGGYFGEALLALGFVSQEELEWGLASQFDLPYIFPDADSVDPEAVSLVSPEWALAHLTLPIMKTEKTLTVVVDSPIKTEAVDVLQARTDLTIELALASPSKIRELIRQVYARAVASEERERPEPVSLNEIFRLALDAASTRFGISTRGHRVWGWYDDNGVIRRRPLDGLWESQLQQLVSPSPQDRIGDTLRTEFTGQINREGMVTPVKVRYLSNEGGSEYLFRPVQERSLLEERFSPPSQGILSEVRLLARSGSARFVVFCDPPDLGPEILPHLPLLLLDPSWRNIYLTDREEDRKDEVFTYRMPEDPEEWGGELESLRAFHFDVVTVDLSTSPEEWAGPVLDVAAVAFVLWDRDEDLRVAHDSGIRWEIRIARAEGERLEWALEPLQ